jgi:hypothetical protein
VRTSQTPAGHYCLAHMPAESGSFVRSPSASPREAAGSYAPEHRLLDRSLTCLLDSTTVPGARHGLVNRGTLPMSVPPVPNVHRRDRPAFDTSGARVTGAVPPRRHPRHRRRCHRRHLLRPWRPHRLPPRLAAHHRGRRIPATAPPQPGDGAPRRPHRLRLPLPRPPGCLHREPTAPVALSRTPGRAPARPGVRRSPERCAVTALPGPIRSRIRPDHQSHTTRRTPGDQRSRC